MSEPIRLAFSPDSDDIFMFWPMLAGKVDVEGLAFTHERRDTEALNALAEHGTVDVIAVSIAHYATLADRYLLLPHGASVGRGYGPVVVAKQQRAVESLRGKRVGVPGLRTTAHLALRQVLPEFEAVVVPIAPYSKAFDAVRSGDVEAALLIHEGRLTFEREGFAKVCDVGEAWLARTGLPLPLGGNVIRRGLGPSLVEKVSRVCRRSIAWALEHREQVMDALEREESRADLTLDRAMLDRYLTMYANADTLDLPDDARRAVGLLMQEAHRQGLVSRAITPEFAP